MDNISSIIPVEIRPEKIFDRKESNFKWIILALCALSSVS